MTQKEGDGCSIEPMVVDVQAIILINYTNAKSERDLIFYIW